jgi:DUF4097 and DUF4098 domain-containing protein YvlB
MIMKSFGTWILPPGALRAAAAAVVIAVVCAGSAGAYEREETMQKSIPLEGASRITVMNSRGDVKVIGEKGRGAISCEYVKRIRGRRQDEADRLFALMDVVVSRDAGGIKVEARYPDETSGDHNILSLLMQHYEGLSLDLNLTVPAGLEVKIITSSGDVQVASVTAPVEITSASGDVEATGIGTLKAAVSSGDITVSSAAGNVFLGTSSGDVNASRVGGDATVQSSSGDITLSGIVGDLTGSSTSGDVEVEGVRNVVFSGTSGSARFTGVRGNVEAAVSSGDVEVGAAPESAADYEIRTSSGLIELTFERVLAGGFALKAQTTSGDISVSLPIKVTKVSRHYLAGLVRNGKSVVVLETASGDISVSEPGE